MGQKELSGTSFASQVYLEASTLEVSSTFAPDVSIPQEQSHNSSTLQPGGSSPRSRGWPGGAGIPPHPQPAQTAAGPDASPGDDSSSTLHTSAGTALDKQLGTCSTSPSPQLTRGLGINRESKKNPQTQYCFKVSSAMSSPRGLEQLQGWSRGTAEALCSCQGTRRRFLIYSKAFNSSAIEQNHRQLARSPLVSRV